MGSCCSFRQTVRSDPCENMDEQHLLRQGSVTKQPTGMSLKGFDKDRKLEKLQDENDELRQKIASYDSFIKENEGRYDSQTLEINKLKEENETLLTRLSASVSAKLTDGNPNIADLSDANRPTKLAEQFSELYDNEWTNAFDALKTENDDKRTDQEICKILLDIMMKIYSRCHARANEDLQTLTKAMTAFIGVEDQSKEVLKALKDGRKKNHSIFFQTLSEDVNVSLKDVITEQEATLINAYIEKCTRICWLMTIQDPPVYIDAVTDLHKQHFVKEKYKPYTQSGEIIDFLIWPVLYLHKDGNILNKGIAQGQAIEQADTDVKENASQ